MVLNFWRDRPDQFGKLDCEVSVDLCDYFFFKSGQYVFIQSSESQFGCVMGILNKGWEFLNAT